MKLYIVQHGEACDKNENPQRPLTEKGKADINRLAVFLRKNNIRVERIIHSGKLRAGQTVERLQNSIASSDVVEVNEHINPNDPVERFTELAFMWDKDTMIVGHQPFLSRLVSQLTLRESTRLFTDFTPGSAVCLQKTPQNQWQLSWMVRPDILK